MLSFSKSPARSEKAVISEKCRFFFSSVSFFCSLLLLSLSLSLSLFLFRQFSPLLLTSGAHEGEVERVEEQHDVLALFD